MRSTIVRHLFFVFGIFLATVLFSCRQTSNHPPLSPQDALSGFQLPQGYRIELVASEPLISDPVEIAFDENGKMYVVQMDDYPSDMMDDYADDFVPRSKISLLEDKDGDGFYESGTVYADSLHYANGVMPWKGGILVSSAPDILFLKDTDGDGKADIKETVLTGFALTNPQLRMSSLRYGLDNWIYAAYSRAGGGKWREAFRGKGSALRFPGQGTADSAAIFPGTNFRFKPDDFKIETSGGMSQFGLTFDSWGNQFTLWNNIHVRHVVIDEQYLLNNPYYRVDAVMADISDHGNAAPVYSITKDMLNLHESEMGHFTSACGNCAYTGGLFTGKYAAANFVCEPVSNLVHADILTPDAPTFKAVRDEPNKEFLTSTDSWFRPVNLTVGPDGALYVVDFYRKLVEHPDWLALADSSGFYTHAGKIKEADFLAGNDRGRIYRIVPASLKKDLLVQPVLGNADLKILVAALDHPNSWVRLNAQRLLTDRKDEQAIPLLNSLLSNTKKPEGKIHALWTLEALGALTDSMIQNAFTDSNAMVRKQAVILAGNRLQQESLLREIIKAAADTDPYVQFQVALTLSAVKKQVPEVVEAQSRILSDHIDNKWFQDAVLLGCSANSLDWYNRFKSFKGKDNSAETGKKEWLRKLASVVGAKYKTDEIASLLNTIAAIQDTGVIVNSLAGLSDGMKSHSKPIELNPAAQQSVVRLMVHESLPIRSAIVRLASGIRLKPTAGLSDIIEKLKLVAKDGTQPADIRVLAVQTTGLDPRGISFALMEELLQANQPSELQLAVAKVLLKDHGQRSAGLLLSRWNLYNLKIHEVVENGFLARKDRLLMLLNAIESGEVKPDWITRDTRNRLLQNSDTTISRRAHLLFGNQESSNREKLIYDYNPSTTGNGNAANGKIVFKANCSVCHSLEGVGVDFGPDLHSVSHQTKINLLTMILNPNHDVAAGFEGYNIETKAGENVVGIISGEDNFKIVLKQMDGQTRTIDKSDVVSVSPLPLSLMPEGLESTIDQDAMRDLIEYIKTLQ